MSEPEREIDVPQHLRGGVWANDVDVFGDLEEATLDFLRIDPRDPRSSVLVARVTLSALVHTEGEVRIGAIHMSKRDPCYKTYKSKVTKPTPEQEAILKRWHEEVEERVQARLRAYYGR